MVVLYKADAKRGDSWLRFFATHAPEVEFRIWPKTGDPDSVRYLALWEPVDGLKEQFPNLEVLFSTGAGVDQFDFAAIPDGVQVVRLIDPAIIAGMREYVSFAVLALHRDMLQYQDSQHQRLWQPLHGKAASDICVGVMGLGSLGQAVLDALKPYGYSLRAWSRSSHEIDGVDCFAGREQLRDFAARADILVCLLPLTPETRGILNRELFNAMPRGASLVNVGRGGHLLEDDLLFALGDGQLSGAVLDVLGDEPPETDHPFWKHPGIWLTPHIASMTGLDSAAKVLLDNIRRHQRGERMIGVIDRELGY